MDRGLRSFRASVLELSELANVGTQAVQASLKRLKEAGLVKHESRDSASSACLYSLFVPQEMAVITTVGKAYTRVTSSVVTTAIQNDAFHLRGLGKSAYSVWQLLITCGSPRTIKDIADATGRSASTVSVNLAKLEKHRLAKKTDQTTPIRWEGCDATRDRLQEIAVLLGTSGRAAKRQEQHLEERQRRVSHVLMRQKRVVFRERK